MITTDKLKVGDSLEPLRFKVTQELNKQILESLDCRDKRYREIVHPALLVGFSNITRSPSYRLEVGVAAMHTHDEIEFLNEAKVGETLSVTWIVTHIYHRRNKEWKDTEYQAVEAMIVNESNVEIIRRRITDIFLRR